MRSRHLDDAVVPLAIELARLPGVAVVRACDGHGAVPEVVFTAASPVTAAALSAALAARQAGRGIRGWEVTLRAGPDLTVREFAVVGVTPRALTAMTTITKGLAVLVCEQAQAVVDAMEGERRRGQPSGLTPREGQVLAAFLRGYSAPTIAAQTGRSEFTVRNQLKSVCAKIGVSSLQALREWFAGQAGPSELTSHTTRTGAAPRRRPRHRRS